MESPCKPNPLALRLVGQDAWSSPKGRAHTPTAVSSPDSATSSVRSTTRLVNYGGDMNRDFAVVALLEDKLGREVEHEELRAAIASFTLLHGHLPSIRQLALELASHHADGGSSSTDVPESPTSRRSPCEARQLRLPTEGDDTVPEAVLCDEPIFFGPLCALRCDETHLRILSHESLARLYSPGNRPPPSPSRFCPVEDSPAERTPLGPRRQLERQWQQQPLPQHSAAPSSERQPLRSLLDVDPGCTAPEDDENGVVLLPAADLIGQKSVARPFVPGLNLRGLKKKPAPSLRSGPSPPTATDSPAAILKAPGAIGSASSSGQRTPDSCSPTEILRMLLPSACKPRPSIGAGAQSRLWGAHLQAGAGVLSDRTASDRVAGSAAAAAAAQESCDVRLLGCLRVSMDDLDQHHTGLRRTTPLKAPPPSAQAAAIDTTSDLIRAKALQATPLGSAHDKRQQHLLQHRTTPGSRGQRLDMQGQDDQDTDPVATSLDAGGVTTADSDLAPIANGVTSIATTLHSSAKRQLVLMTDPPCGDGSRHGSSQEDNGLRKDTAIKAVAALAAANIASSVAATSAADTCMTVGDAVVTLHCSRSALSAGPAVAPPVAAGGGSREAPQRALHGASLVPPLRLSCAGAGAPGQQGAAAAGARHRSCPAAPSTCVPPLVLDSNGQQEEAQQMQLPTGARTRRLSICLPSAMVYGEGPLTTRRMAAGANTGVTSHALCTVFWVDSEDELGAYGDDSDSYDMDEIDEEEGNALEHGVDFVLGHPDQGDAGAIAEAPQDLIAAMAAAAVAEPHPSPPGPAHDDTRGGGGGGGRSPHRGRGRRGVRRRRRANDDDGGKGADPDRGGGGLMLPEQLWDAWERLSDGPKGRQYRLLESLTHVERITCTSYSTVSKACHQGQPVVVKIYDVAERDKLANAFAEIGVLRHLDGWPGAVRLLDFGRHEDKVMLMLERCDVSLKDWCDAARFETATGADYILECLRMWWTLAELLTQLHERWHVAHCDLKPGNVLLSAGRLVLADFSESMLFNETPILQDQARGTVPYQPPEMVHGHCVDARKADVWAMGCILYEMITGELLFRGNSDCMRAVAAKAAGGAVVRLRLRLPSSSHRHARGGGGREAGAAAPRQPRPSHQQLSQRAGPAALPAAAVPPLRQQQQQHWDIIRSCPEQAEPVALWEQAAAATTEVVPPAAGEDGGSVAAGSAMQQPPPRVPRLPLALTRAPAPPSGVPPSGSPWRGGQTAPSLLSARGAAGSLPPLPPHFFIASGAAYCVGGGGSAQATGRSLELIAEDRCGGAAAATAEDASSLASADPWVVMSVLHTAPTTARSTARSHNLPYYYPGHDTARSVASTAAGAAAGPGSVACWPPAPPPSAGTARSVADSEWTLAMPAATTTATAVYGQGPSARPCAGAGPSSNRSAAGPYASAGAGSADGDGLPASTGPPPPPLLPPHRRLRHSVATQCADPAGPDWLTTEEADRLRIMCDEPPSFVLVHYHGGGSDTARVEDDDGAAAAGGSSVSDGGSGGAMATVAASLRDLYEPRRLSSAEGPTLGDDVLGLLRAVLVEDHARPSMRQVAAMAAEALARHCPAAEPSPLGSGEGSEATAASSSPLDVYGPEDAAAEPPAQPCGPDSSSTTTHYSEEFALGTGRRRQGEAVAGGSLGDTALAGADAGGFEAGGTALAAAARGVCCHGGAHAQALGQDVVARLSMPCAVGGGDVYSTRASKDQGTPMAAPAEAALRPRLCLNLLQRRASSCYDGSNNSGGGATAPGAGASGGGAGEGWGGPLTAGTDGGCSSWEDSGSIRGRVDAGAPVDMGGGGTGGGGTGGGGGRTPPVVAGGGADGAADHDDGTQAPGQQSVSLFDVCQPLVTSRGPRPFSRVWQRFLTKQE